VLEGGRRTRSAARRRSGATHAIEENSMPTRTMRRLSALGALLVTGVAAVPALAHAPVTGTFPRNNSTLSNVRTVSVRFGEAVVTGLISVKRANGSTVAARASGLQPTNKARLRATFARKLAPGRYTVSWRALADDGHRERGTFRFRVR
jgi:methionine-rich copper-binding protein CopC